MISYTFPKRKILNKGQKMNTSTILANKEAFDFWLNGGEVFYKSKKEWRLAGTTHQWTSETGTVYVQNDKYVDLRKAEAEGKTIEYSPSGKEDGYSPMRSIDRFNRDIEHYRIKRPEMKEWNFEVYTVNPVTKEGGYDIIMASVIAETKDEAKEVLSKWEQFDCIILFNFEVPVKFSERNECYEISGSDKNGKDIFILGAKGSIFSRSVYDYQYTLVKI
jgi:hypothetical protein